MEQTIITELSKRLSIKDKYVETVLTLLKDNTVPFIARYRKEMTGGLDEESIREIDKAYQYQKQLKDRKEDVIRLIDEKGLLTDELKINIESAKQLIEVEDLYRPFKEKKKTKATIAVKKGLEPLADLILEFKEDFDPHEAAQAFITEEVETVEDALEGASHIIAERISDDAKYRKWIRNQTFTNGQVISKVKKDAKDEQKIFEMYYDFRDSIKHIKLFRVLALNRGEKEKVLRVKIDMDESLVHNYLHRQLIQSSTPSESIVEASYKDAYKRLIGPSIERELRSELTEKAEDHAIHIFSENLRALLLSPPLKGKKVLGVDPAYRTGCKLAALDEMGTLKSVDVMYPHPKKPNDKVTDDATEKAEQKVLKMIHDHNIDIIAIGNGTASRQTEAFIVKLLKKLDKKVFYTIVNEAGASVYSASPLAKKEFPTLQVEERSAVSIARRLQDPLSELVKIDPKSIGVGQYQHDVSQSKLSDSLDFTVETAVNQVGVDLNVASPSLLNYISGVSSKVAKNIVAFREEHGAFTNRKQLKKVSGLGAKSFEQSVGFLRIAEGDNPLDKTSIHPESYEVAMTILDSVDAELTMIGTDALREKIKPLQAKEYTVSTGAGVPTIEDIFASLISPLRDPRDDAPAPILKSDILSLEDLKKGMKLRGTVRNVVDFGAFIDCGVKEDGLVHISKLTKQFVKHPLDVVKVGDVVDVWVEDVDLNRNRLQLSMIEPNQQ